MDYQSIGYALALLLTGWLLIAALPLGVLKLVQRTRTRPSPSRRAQPGRTVRVSWHAALRGDG